MNNLHFGDEEQVAANSEVSIPRVQIRPIGEILREADLVSAYQLDLALQDRENFPHLRLGEIMAMRGWIDPRTADFFVEDWSQIVRDENRQPIGYYLVKSALLQPEQIETILEEQKNTGIRFGTIAVMQGLLKSTTLDFFLMSLYPQELATSPFITMHGRMSLDTSEEEYIDVPLFEMWDEIDWEDR